MKEVTYTDIKTRLATKYGGGYARPDDMNRPLIAHQRRDGDDAVVWLAGSPPKGYCIAGNGQVSLYDLNGKRFKIFISTVLVKGDYDGR